MTLRPVMKCFLLSTTRNSLRLRHRQSGFYKSRPLAAPNRNHTTTSNVLGTIPKDGKGIQISQHASIERLFSQEDITQFGQLIGDLNPIHVGSYSTTDDDDDFDIATTMTAGKRISSKDHLDSALWNRSSTQEESATQSLPDETVVHGILVAGLFSSIFGTLAPGSVYLKQTLQFRHVVFVNEPVVAQVEVTKLRSWRGGMIATCNTKVVKMDTITNKNLECVRGVADVWLPKGSNGSQPQDQTT